MMRYYISWIHFKTVVEVAHHCTDLGLFPSSRASSLARHSHQTQLVVLAGGKPVRGHVLIYVLGFLNPLGKRSK